MKNLWNNGLGLLLVKVNVAMFVENQNAEQLQSVKIHSR